MKGPDSLKGLTVWTLHSSGYFFSWSNDMPDGTNVQQNLIQQKSYYIK
jgi:hypothetical protein